MLLFEAWCRPYGRAGKTAHFVFLVPAIDTRAARQIAMKWCFYGSNVSLKGGGKMRLDPLAWTVCRVKELEDESATRDCPKIMDWPRPSEELANSATHDTAVARLYAGLRYESYRFRPSRSVIDCCQGSRLVTCDKKA